MSIQRVDGNGRPLPIKESEDSSVMMEIAGAEAILGFNPRKASDNDDTDWDYEDDSDDDDVI